MKSQKTTPTHSPLSAATLSEKSTPSKVSSSLNDQRPQQTAQLQLQNLATQQLAGSKTAQLKSVIQQGQGARPVVQLVLRNNNAQTRALAARLTREYRADEAAGDRVGLGANNAAQNRAIALFNSAKAKRRRVRGLHTPATRDPGHVQAIQTLNNKIATRRRIINQRNAGGRARRPAVRL